MSARMNVTQTVELAGEGARLARVDEATGDLSIYPGGVGYGPVFTMSKLDWARIQREAMLAYIRAEGGWPRD